jgi:hypothetical protein
MTGRIWAIALNTFREAARIRVLYGILVLVLGANLLAVVLGEMVAGEEARVARDVGLAGISLFGSLTAIFLGVFLLYTEVQRRTIHVIVSKPIERWEFVVGKYLGMALVLTVLVALFGAAMLVMLVLQDVGVSSAVAKALVLAWIEVLTVGASGRAPPDVVGASGDAAPWIRTLTRITLEIVPDLHLFAVSGRSIDGEHVSVHADMVSWGYVGLSSLHGLGWIVGLLALAALLFHRRDFV